MKRFRVLLSFIMPYRWHAVRNIVFNIISAVFALFTYSLVSPFLKILFGKSASAEAPGAFDFSMSWFERMMNWQLSGIIEKFDPRGALLAICIAVLIASLFKNLFIFAANNAMAYLRAGTTKDMRNRLYNKVVRLPVSYFTEARKGDVLTRMSNDVQEVQVSVMGSLTMLFRDPITIIIFLIYLFYSSFQLTLFALVLMPLSGWLIGSIGKSLRTTSFKGQQNLGRLLSVVEETLSSLRIIKAFNAEEKMNDQFAKSNDRFTKIFRRVIRKRYLASPTSEFLSTGVLMVVLYFGGIIALKGTDVMTSDRLMAFIIVFSQIIPPAKNITTAYFNVQKGLASLDRIDQVLQADNKIIEKKDAVEVKGFNSSIEYKNVSFTYNKEPVLRDISFTLEKGKTLALVGKSGSGKSTLVDLLPRFIDVDKGSITIDGVDIRDCKLKQLRSQMGIVSQDAILFNDTFRRNIAFGRDEVSDEEVEKAAMIANAHQFIIESEGGYDYVVGEGGTRLSGGQRQRISIARAVIVDPPILILDEATSALDTESERLVQDAIENLMKNRTSIVIAHRLSTVQRADMILVLNEGRIVENGTHAELIRNKKGLYYKLYQMQMMQ